MYIVLFLDTCPYSHAAKDLLEEKNLDHRLIIFSNNFDSKSNTAFIDILNKEYKIKKNEKGQTIFEKKAFKDFFGEDSTFPRVYKDKDLIGGYDNLKDKLA